MKRIRARHARKAPRNSKDRSSKNSKTNQKLREYLREYISPNSIKILILNNEPWIRDANFLSVFYNSLCAYHKRKGGR